MLTICFRRARRRGDSLANTITSLLVGMSRNQVDILIRRAMLFSKMFTTSWGRPEILEIIKNGLDQIISKQLTMELVERSNSRMVITKEYHKNSCQYLEGYFTSPLLKYSSKLFSTDNIAISHWKGFFTTKNARATLILLAPTGDHSYALRQYQFSDHLLKHGINTILVQNPFYSMRKPKDQFRSALSNVSDLFTMGASLITECAFLFKWVKEGDRFSSIMGISGVSMGGFNASLVVASMDFPIFAVPCLTWTSAAPIFTLGALSHSVGWRNLEAELDSPRFREEIQKIKDCDWLDKLHAGSIENPNFTRSQLFMWILMSEFTNLQRYAIPLQPNLVKFIIGEHDEYIRRDNVPDVRDIWPGSEVQILPKTGHIQGFLYNAHHFRSGVLEMLTKAEQHTKNIGLIRC